MKVRNKKNYDYIYNYLNEVIEAFASRRRRQCQGRVTETAVYTTFYNKTGEFENFVSDFLKKL